MLLLIYLTSVEFSVESSYAHTHNGGLRSSVRQCPDHHAHYPVHSQRDANCRLLIRLKSEILKQQSALIHIQRDESFKARQLLLHSFSAFLDVSSVFLLICHIFFCHNNLTCDRKERPDGLEYKGRTDRCHWCKRLHYQKLILFCAEYHLVSSICVLRLNQTTADWYAGSLLHRESMLKGPRPQGFYCSRYKIYFWLICWKWCTLMWVLK